MVSQLNPQVSTVKLWCTAVLKLHTSSRSIVQALSCFLRALTNKTPPIHIHRPTVSITPTFNYIASIDLSSCSLPQLQTKTAFLLGMAAFLRPSDLARIFLLSATVPEVTQNLFYNIFAIFAGQGKHASDSIKKSFKAFCESTSLTQSDLDKYASRGYITIVSSMAKQYETLVRNYVCSTYEDRTLRHILNVLSEKTSPYFCGDSLTVKQRKSLAKHIFRQKINPKSAWPFAIDRIERYETIVNGFLTFWSTYDAYNDADIPSEANLYAKPQCYMKWLHFIQKEMEQKKFIQEMKLQDKASSSYVHQK
ncbi:hypothetical protein RMATCC62417_18450 [Rhizopus microsporus]|nr:hypothetical protein RMATCC62417_18450 [Rhizopus microsporus]